MNPARLRLREMLRDAVKRLRGDAITPARAAAAAALGLFIGSQPIFGFHTALVLALCVWLRLDFVIAWVASNVSNPFFAPALVAAELQVGLFVRTGEIGPPGRLPDGAFALSALGRDLVIGALIVGAALAALGAAITWAAVTLWRRRAAR